MSMVLAGLAQAALERVASESGMPLTASEEREIAETERACLADAGRISFGEGASVRLVRAFAASPFVPRDNAAAVLKELTEVFYELREDFPASVTDAEIVELLAASFDGEAAGDVRVSALQTREALSKRLAQSPYEIADDEGGIYRWDQEEWREDLMADGWYGERWEAGDE